MKNTTHFLSFSLGFLPRIKPVCFIVFLFTSFWNTSRAQENLVPNGSFEVITECPSGADLYKVDGWFSPNQATPDFFNSCADIANNCSVPTNGAGFQPAQDGNGYVGIVAYSYNGSSNNYREYVSIKLTNPLVEDKLYRINLYINQANVSPIAVNNVSYGFCNDTINQFSQNVISPLFSFQNKKLIRDTVNWVNLSGYHLATGLENYIIIGNFYNDSETDTLTMDLPYTDVYYYVDNVSVYEVPFGIENVFTPNGDGINDTIFKSIDLDGFKVEILNRWGELINEVNMTDGWNGKSNNGNDVKEGVYFYRIINGLDIDKEVFKTGFIHLIR